MAKQNVTSLINKYLKRIRKGDIHLTSIHLTKVGLLDADLAPLLKAFAEDPDAAARITVIFLNMNELEKLTIKGFPNLKTLHVAHNKLRVIKLKKLPKLTQLYAGNNLCTSAHLEHLPSLRTICFTNNNVVSAHISKLATPVKRNVYFDADQLTIANRIALQKIKSQDQLLTIKLNNDSRMSSIEDENLTLTTPILAQHFTAFSNMAELNEYQEMLNCYAWVFCSLQNETIPPDIMWLTSNLILELDSINPQKMLKKEVKFLKNAFRADSVEVDEDGFLAVTRNSSTLTMFNNYMHNMQFKILENFCSDPSHALLPKFCLSFKRLKDRQRAEALEFKRLEDFCSAPSLTLLP